MREILNIDSGWLFHLGEIEIGEPLQKGPIYSSSKSESVRWGPAARYYDDRSDSYGAPVIPTDNWITVDLPHDYIVNQPLDKEANNTRGYIRYQNAWYRKRIKISANDSGKRILLQFGAIATHCTVYVNGHLIKRNFCGYVPFEADITDVVEYDENAVNVIAVYTDAKKHEGWWYEGGGICRHVRLVKTSPICVDTYGIHVIPEKKSDKCWIVSVNVSVLNESDSDENIDVIVKIKGKSGTAAEAKQTVFTETGKHADAKLELPVSSPLLWDTESPNMYDAEVTLIKNGEETDRDTARFGFRTFRFDSDEGFILNGRRVQINGVCCHEGFGITGRAVPDAIQRYQIQLMKEMGANGYRTAHYPHDEATMDALDENGFIVMDETRWFNTDEESIKQLETLIKRDRNRPGVFMWSIGNEEPCYRNATGVRIAKRLTRIIKALDSTRPVTSAADADPLNSATSDQMEMIGINYNLQKWDDVKLKYPDKPIFISECCATGTTRGWYEPDNSQLGRLSAYDKDTNSWFLGREKTAAAVTARKWIAGAYQWAGIEHRGETQWPRICSSSGAVDMYLIKKDAFYQNKSFWTDEPMVHILPHWNLSEHTGEEIRVVVYTNCEAVELIQDGVSLGTQHISDCGHAEWNVIYKPGSLTARGLRNGVYTEETVKTTGKAESIALYNVTDIPYKGERGYILVNCVCLDCSGLIVPDASPEILFYTNNTAAAKIKGTGSDICDHVPPESPLRRMWAGSCMVLIETSGLPGEITLFAKSHGLITGKFKFTVK